MMFKKGKTNLLLKFFLLILLFGLLSLRRDGYFPFSRNLDPIQAAWLQFTQTILVFLILIFFISDYTITIPDKIIAFIDKYLFQFLILLVPILIISILLLLIKDTYVFSEYYSRNLSVFIGLGVFTVLIIILPLLKGMAKLSIVMLFVGSFLLFLIPILYFPITAKLSDLMPIINKQLEAFVACENIYQYYLLDNGVWTQAVRQPGTILSYFPAFLLGVDLRVVSIIFTLMTGIMFLSIAYKDIYKIKFNKRFLKIYLMIALFLLFPYRHVRADLYEPFYWFLLTLSLYLLNRSKLFMFSFIWGIGIFTQVWSWLFSPFVSLYLWRKYGFKKALEYSFVFLLFGIIPLLFFILPNPQAYYEHIFGFYKGLVDKGIYEVNSIYLTPLFHIYGLGKYLLPSQILSVAFIGITAIFKLRKFKHLLYCLALVFFIFVQFNSLTWNYMYIDLLAILIISLLIDLRVEK